mgnify:FL=1
MVNGAEVNYPISYSNTLEECKSKSARVIYLIKLIEPPLSNIKGAKCIQINVLSEPYTNA